MKPVLQYFVFTIMLLSIEIINAQTFVQGTLPGQYYSGGVTGVWDMNSDGLSDIVVMDQSTTLRILFQQPNGSFTQVNTATSPLGQAQWGMTVGDYDNDGFGDVMCGGNYDGVHFYNIDGDGNAVMTTNGNANIFMQACLFGDIDNDGWLDAFACHDDGASFMFRNDGAGMMVPDQTLINYNLYQGNYPGTNDPLMSGNYGNEFSDFDRDGDMDLLVAKCRQASNDPLDPRRTNLLFVNDGNNVYTDDAAARGLVNLQQSWTATFGDIDNDGDFDCFMTTHSGGIRMYENNGLGYFTDISQSAGLTTQGFFMQGQLADFDNDGFLDVLHAGGSFGYYHNNGNNTFTQMNNLIANPQTMHGYGLGDLNNDGFTDIYANYGNANGYVTPSNQNDILWLSQPNGNHWVGFDLEGTISNRNAVGALVEIHGPWGTQIREVRSGVSYGITNSNILVFGIGSNAAVDYAVIHWPAGGTQVVTNPTVDAYTHYLETPCFAYPMVSITSNGATSICPGDSVQLGAFLQSGTDIFWSNGQINTNVTANETELFTAYAFDSISGCSSSSEQIEILILEQIAPTIDMQGQELTCEGSPVLLTASPGISYLWNNGWTEQILEVNNSGEYSVQVDRGCGFIGSEEMVSISIIDAPSLNTQNYQLDVSGDIDMSVIGTGEIGWYDDAEGVNLLAIGSNYSTYVNSTSTYYVEAINSSPLITAQGGNPSNSTSGQYSNSTFHLLFDAAQDMIIDSVMVYALNAGQRNIELITSSGVQIAFGTFDVPAGQSYIPLNFAVPQGTGYGLRPLVNSQPGLWRDGLGSALAYPYQINDVSNNTLATITGTTVQQPNSFNYYYYFYDWHISAPTFECSTGLVPITVYVGEVLGCNNLLACNYNSIATVDDGTCVFPELYYNCIGQCLNDADNDGICDENEILGCTDSSASNYNPAATQDDGSCAQVFTCNITASSTTLCEGESVTLSVNTTGGVGASSQLPANLQQGLVAYYPFNGNANDESGNGNNGVVNGATLTADRFGNVGSAYYFSDDKIEISHNPSLGFIQNQGFSVSLWTISDIGHPTSHLIGKRPNGAQSFNWHIADWEGIQFSSTSSTNIFGALSNQPVSSQFWNHVVGVYDSGNWLLYLNGELIISSYSSFFTSDANTPLVIGNSGNWGGYFGKIDDVVIYNRTLSPSEIQQLYTAQSYTWSNNETTPIITVSPTTNTTYSCTVTQGNQTCTASVDISVNPNIANTISATIIQGETYTLGAQTLTSAGTYAEVFTSAAGCDSTVTLTLSVEPLLTCEINAPTTTLCEGESVTLSVNTTGGAGASSQLPANLQQGLVAYYPFNGNANDESGNGFDGIVQGASITQDRNSLDGRAYYFNNSFIDISGYPIINQGATEKSILCWIKMDSPGDFWNMIVSTGQGSSQGAGSAQNGKTFSMRALQCSEPKSKLSLMAWDANSTGYDFCPSSSVKLDDGIWHFVALTFSNNVLNGFVDGSLSYSHNYPVGFINTNGQSNFIGKSNHQGWETFFKGIIDDIAIYNRALSPSEIQQLYTAQSYAWSTNENTPTITVSPTQTTTYTATVTTATQTCTDSITITVNPLLTWYADTDTDGFGNPDDVVQDCNQPQGYIADNTDCNDDDATTYPRASEICDNNRDENCDGVDSLCFVPILGCTDVNACNFNPEANTDDGSCILPQTETCNGLDDNCNGQVDEGISIASVNAVSATTALYPVCSGNSIRSANLNNGANSAVIEGNGNDLWYSFTAQYNTFRAGLSAATGDNDLRLYTMTPGGCLELIETEHEITAGNQTLLSDQLNVGQTYYVAVHNISGPMNASAKICFNHLTGSTCDHYYSNNTGIYNSVCNSFKAQYRANAVSYGFEVLSASQNSIDQGITSWTYTTPNAVSVVSRLGMILPANQGIAPILYTLKVPVLYSLFDAAGNFENLFAQATSTCTVTLNAEATIALRSSDRCPTNKSLTSTIAPDRTVCGAMRYDWELTEILPNPGVAQVVQGGAYASAFFLSNVPGITVGKTYSVRVRPVHSSGITGNWGAVQCLRVGSAGLVNHPGSADADPPLLPKHRDAFAAGGEMIASYAIYPNPTSIGSFVLQYNGARRGELIFAQEPTTSESNFAQESMTELVMMDITGKVVFKTNVVLNGNLAEIHFGDLESGLYLVDFGGERSRVQVLR